MFVSRLLNAVKPAKPSKSVEDMGIELKPVASPRTSESSVTTDVASASSRDSFEMQTPRQPPASGAPAPGLPRPRG
jgi:hypothetical protein